jgi:DNA-binding CsgD family transcriptional regulator
LVIAGMSTRQIAERLVVSPHTMQDHLKAIFEKTGMRSRRELVARVFYQDHLPHIVAGAPLDSGGAIAGR